MKKTILALVLMLALFLGIAEAPMLIGGGAPRALAAVATPQTDEYAGNELIRYFSKTMNEQLIACLSGSDGLRARIDKYDEPPYKSMITFFFDTQKLSGLSGNDVLSYVGMVIYSNPNMCMLSTNILYSSYSGEVSVVSLVDYDKYGEAIRGYKSFLADLERVPRAAASMTDEAILLYLHDRLIQQAKYAEDLSGKDIYIPLTMAESGVVVCQSYAAVMNQLMRDLGFVCYAVESKAHSWNVVKINGKWSYLDATWDDPVGHYRDYVLHKYLLVDKSAFSDAHQLDDFDRTVFPGLESKLGAVDLLPKSEYIQSPMCFDGENWFYASGGQVYRWDGTSPAAQIEQSIPADRNRCVGEISGSIYVGGSDGLFLYKPERGELIPYDTSISVMGLMYYKKALYYRANDDWTRFLKVEEPYTTYESLNGTDNLEVVTLIKPKKPTILVKKSSAKSIRVTATKRAEGANKGYEIQVARNKSFTFDKKSKSVTGTTGSVTGLTPKTTYYVRMRGIWKDPMTINMKIGSWSAVKKIRL